MVGVTVMREMVSGSSGSKLHHIGTQTNILNLGDHLIKGTVSSCIKGTDLS